MKNKRKYTIKQNRNIVKCPKCKTSIIKGEKCLKCEKDDEILKYPKDVSNNSENDKS